MTAALSPRRRLAPEDEQELMDMLRARSVSLGRFRLASGIESTQYFNAKTTMMHPRGAYLIALAFMDRILEDGADLVGGLEMGAVPIMGALAAVSYVEGDPIQTFFVRKSAKVRGEQHLVEGLSHEESLAGKRVILIDDVATMGSSLIKAADAVRAQGADIRGAIVLVDREEGARETLAKLGIPLRAVFKASDFA